MARPSTPQKALTNWTARGAQLMAARDYRAALQAFGEAARADKGVAIHRYHMALAQWLLTKTALRRKSLLKPFDCGLR